MSKKLTPQDSSVKVPLHDNSFESCVVEITGLPASNFKDIDSIVYTVGLNDWYSPYREALRVHSYDMIFFYFKDNNIILNEDVPLSSFEFKSLPYGKCIILGKDATGHFKCVVALMRDERAVVIYDPKPETTLSEVFEVGYFISTFISDLE